MDKINEINQVCNCGSHEFKEYFNPLSIVNVDTILISARHLYRSPYSLNEKSGLVSLPINPDHVLKFEKDIAEPEKVKVNTELIFLDSSAIRQDEAKNLLVQAFDFQLKEHVHTTVLKNYTLPEQAIPEEFFPQSIKKGLQGMTDGKKRFLFILINFLATSGWTHKMIEQLVLEWNKQNNPPLKDNYIIGQIRYSSGAKKPMPPPNYNTGIYRDLGIQEDEHIMKKYKNPVTYSRALYEQNKKKTKKLTDEQKEMRKAYREKLKKTGIPKQE